MTRWRTTGALGRAAGVSATGLCLSLLFGEPVLVVVAGPFLVLTALGLVHRPRSAPRIAASLDHHSLHEGQGTRSRLRVDDLSGVEHLTRISTSVPHVAQHPADGRVGGLVRDDRLSVIEISPRRWGPRLLGEENVALTSPWSGFRWGPVLLPGSQLQVLPVNAPYDSRAEAPQPVGLVGAHRSRRLGGGSEFAGIRAFQSGDRVRRINWRVSLRSAALHVVTTRAEEDAGVLLVVDALADHGRSGGVDGAASSLDVTVRAASALAEHHTRTGDRVALRVVGPRAESEPFGSGQRHLRRLLGSLARLQVGPLPHERGLTIGATSGTVVIVLSPMLSHDVGTAAATLLRRGLPVMVVDTLPADVVPAVIEGTDPRIADLAWRMRRLERDQVLARLAAMGCPVVVWRGPGTVDEVMRRLARRAQLPQVRVR